MQTVRELFGGKSREKRWELELFQNVVNDDKPCHLVPNCYGKSGKEKTKSQPLWRGALRGKQGSRD
jgi:hypothetical protein